MYIATTTAVDTFFDKHETAQFKHSKTSLFKYLNFRAGFYKKKNEYKM